MFGLALSLSGGAGRYSSSSSSSQLGGTADWEWTGKTRGYEACSVRPAGWEWRRDGRGSADDAERLAAACFGSGRRAGNDQRRDGEFCGLVMAAGQRLAGLDLAIGSLSGQISQSSGVLTGLVTPERRVAGPGSSPSVLSSLLSLLSRFSLCWKDGETSVDDGASQTGRRTVLAQPSQRAGDAGKVREKALAAWHLAVEVDTPRSCVHCSMVFELNLFSMEGSEGTLGTQQC
ncbi:hypothetical protein F4780DRAFT_509393 [Xylariomycetidae sp. FL0641]|nr:hypothetical protein F4780DRAFT_509393 [Xylariomycetidae sp. FL0641]